MTFSIYGLRLRGEREVRYVGHTTDTAKRLGEHFRNARQMPWATNFANWLMANAASIEIVELDRADCRPDARIKERAAVAFCLALDHRLFNQWLVPANRRCAPRDDETPPKRFAA